ncbi:PREDICTED: THAP domain-containing protein 1-like, partial [Vollenhovia emeryi]|uniref:THAP domain-containing protein 1-like n=1 Tax=Vollenhovia emeryi TaxID=411798 RepID=UPI0005F368FC
MPGCVVPNCYNSSEKKFKMCHFPLKDPTRCAVWVNNIKRKNWTPNKHSTICQVHFAPEAWEQHRADGMLKLKNNAVPTLFANSGSLQQLLPQTPSKVPRSKDPETQNQTKIPDAELLSLKKQGIEINENPANKTENSNTDISSEATISEDEEVFMMQQNKLIRNKIFGNLCQEQKMKKLLNRYTKSEKLRKTTKKKLLQAKLKIKRLEKEIHTMKKIPNAIRTLFDDNQIKLLCGDYKKVPCWSNDALQRAYRYKFACGSTGYE